MELLRTGAVAVGLAVCLGALPAAAQMRDNTEKQLSCDNNDYNNDRARHCEMREQTVPAAGSLKVDAGRNGGATIKGWLRSEVLVRSRVEASADSEGAAASMTSMVMVDSSGGQVHATGPESRDHQSWSVSYEIFVPQSTDLTVQTYNGGLSISDVRGQIRFTGHNGGVTLKRVAGDVSGDTVNGGVHVELAGNIWDGRQLEVSTRNGGVTLTMPSNYSAHVQAETTNGGLSSDFPMTLRGDIKPRNVDFNVGAGGPLIHISTENGGVKLQKTE